MLHEVGPDLTPLAGDVAPLEERLGRLPYDFGKLRREQLFGRMARSFYNLRLNERRWY